MGEIKALYKKPGEELKESRIDNTLEALQEAVGGHIETLTLDHDLVVVCNEEGKLRGMDYNATVASEDIVGPFLALGVDADEFADCPVDPEEFKFLYMDEEE